MVFWAYYPETDTTVLILSNLPSTFDVVNHLETRYLLGFHDDTLAFNSWYSAFISLHGGRFTYVPSQMQVPFSHPFPMETYRRQYRSVLCSALICPPVFIALTLPLHTP